jgi:hypothetical protein
VEWNRDHQKERDRKELPSDLAGKFLSELSIDSPELRIHLGLHPIGKGLDGN